MAETKILKSTIKKLPYKFKMTWKKEKPPEKQKIKKALQKDVSQNVLFLEDCQNNL